MSFSPTGVEQAWTVPNEVTSVHVVLVGGRGANDSPTAGRGAVVTGDLAVEPGQVLYVEVGGDGSLPSGAGNGAGGFNGGGNGGDGNDGSGAGGGGASDIRTIPRASGGSLDSRLIIAAGGGGRGAGAPGTGSGGSAVGGAGGAAGTAGANGPNATGTVGIGGGAGTQAAGGAGGANGPGTLDGGSGATGAPGVGGTGGSSSTTFTYGGGGGGGGYYGGGGGGAGQSGSGGGGGGGSSFTGTATGASVAPNTTTAGASVVISYIPGGTPPDPTPGGDTGVVDATIDMAASTVCIELSATAIDFGTGQFGAVDVAGSPEVVVTNCSAAPLTLLAHGTDATGTGASWNLVNDSATCADTLGTDNYHLRLHESQTPDVFWSLDTTNTELEDIAAGSIGQFVPLIDTACPGSSGAGQQMSMQIVFVAVEPAP